MDGKRFDDWTRRLGDPTPRRQALRLLGAGIASVLTAPVRPGAAAPPNRCGKLTCAAGETCLKGPGGPQCCPTALVCGRTCLAAPCQEPCQVCDPASGACVPAANGTACEADNDLCTVGDSCQNGVCLPGAPVTCPACQTCVGGACQVVANNLACGPGQICCGGTCVVNTTATNCGTCGNACGNGKVCSSGQCVCDPTITCTSPKVLNTSTCACECPATSCPEGQPLDPTTCTCGLRCINTCSPNGNEGSHCDRTTGLCTCDEGLVVCPFGGASNGSEFICCPTEYTCCSKHCPAAGGGVFDGCCPSGVPCGSPECINRFPGQC